ncbi:hypothetical protein DRN67_03315 [Candidatus Micrarchaeota archaeon]|nr:MAG: hypothetical protein DRN67_03315 [Candidatus Micrarchaeota archaeon]
MSTFLLSPILVPLALYLIKPQKANKLLLPLGAWMTKYGRFVAGLIFLAFGLYLIVNSWSAVQFT